MGRKEILIPKSCNATYKIGNTTINVIAPDITEEERKKRWADICGVASKIVQSMIDKGEME